MGRDNRDPVDDAIVGFGNWLSTGIFGFVIGLILGNSQKNQAKRQTLVCPPSLEAEGSGWVYVPFSQRPWQVRNAGWLSVLLGLIAFSLLFQGLGGLSRNFTGGLIKVYPIVKTVKGHFYQWILLLF